MDALVVLYMAAALVAGETHVASFEKEDQCKYAVAQLAVQMEESIKDNPELASANVQISKCVRVEFPRAQ